MSTHEVCQTPYEPIVTHSFNLLDLAPGQVLAVTTKNSTYWVTATNKMRQYSPSLVIGVSVMTNSQKGIFTNAPAQTAIRCNIIVGRPLLLGRSGIGATSPVTSLTIL